MAGVIIRWAIRGPTLAGAMSMSHQNKLWTLQISSGDAAVNGAGFFIMAKQLL